MRRAYIGIRSEPSYRRDAFASGLRTLGYDVRWGPPQSYETGIVYCCWNRYEPFHETCTRIERAGGVALIAENGYIKGPLDGGEYYALAIGGHNGSGRWHVGGPERWDALGVDLKPWREDGQHILVAPNRSFGTPGLAMPLEWPHRVVRRLRALTDREIRVRLHPGVAQPKRTLEQDLENCWAVVIWASSVGVKALIAGIPVLYDAPHWIGRRAGFVARVPSEWDEMEGRSADYLDACRRNACDDIAWAQWNLDEIASGEPFARLLTPSD